MSKPTGSAVAAKAIAAVAEGHTYAEMDCQAFVEYCVNQCGGSMAYAGSNDMYRNAMAYLATIENAKAEGKLVPGAGLLIVEEVSDGTPTKYRGDGLGDATHVGLYVGEKALQDTDKSGNTRWCNTVHSSASRERVVGGTTGGGWTHVILFKEIDYGVETDGLTLSTLLSDDDTTKENPEGIADTTDVSKFFTVKRGCKGGAVRRLQGLLNDGGYTDNDGKALVVDGEFGAKTEAAVIKYQAAKGLKQDGIIGPISWKSLLG